MNKELEFLEEKHGDNSWGNYPPSKREVAQWLQEWTEKQFAIHSVSQQRELLKFFSSQLSENLDIDVGMNYITEEDIEECLKNFNCG